jgi:hypothetical protein
LGVILGLLGRLLKNTFVGSEQVKYLAFVETNTADYRDFFVLTRITHSIKHSPLELSLSL